MAEKKETNTKKRNRVETYEEDDETYEKRKQEVLRNLRDFKVKYEDMESRLKQSEEKMKKMEKALVKYIALLQVYDSFNLSIRDSIMHCATMHKKYQKDLAQTLDTYKDTSCASIDKVLNPLTPDCEFELLSSSELQSLFVNL